MNSARRFCSFDLDRYRNESSISIRFHLDRAVPATSVLFTVFAGWILSLIPKLVKRWWWELESPTASTLSCPRHHSANRSF